MEDQNGLTRKRIHPKVQRRLVHIEPTKEKSVNKLFNYNWKDENSIFTFFCNKKESKE